MKKILLCAFFICLPGCVERYESPLKTEKATVINRTYVPKRTTTTSGSTGLSSGGDLVLNFGETVTIPEEWVVVFKCEHGETFGLSGEKLFNVCDVGKIVELKYVDIIENSKDDVAVVVDRHTRGVIIDHTYIQR